MLQNFDTVLAFTLVMLLLSMVITTAVQLLVSLTGLRGKQLVWGLRMLLIEAGKNTKAARALTRKILTYPALAPARNPLGWLVRLPRWFMGAGGKRKVPAWLDWCHRLGQREPTAISLENIELVLESLGEELDDAANTKLKEWYATIMDSTTERFKLRSRWITAGGAILLAFGGQVDSGEIFQQLNQSPEVRTQMIAQADELQGLYQELGKTSAIEDEQKKIDALQETRESLNKLVTESQLTIIKGWDSDELEALSTVGPENRDRTKVALVLKRLLSPSPGIIITALLLSLGAPFWYGALSNLLNFRSIVTQTKKKEQD